MFEFTTPTRPWAILSCRRFWRSDLMDPTVAADEEAYHSYVLYFQPIFPNAVAAAPPDGAVHDEGDRAESTWPMKVHGAN
ncbi:hypothetical protein LQW54_006990 [Pestalotiopsis sp. IQ-011]